MTPPSTSDTRSDTASHITQPRFTDYGRQILNVLTAPLIWVISTLSFYDSRARSPEGLSEINQSLIVPLGIAFSIWFPIFIGCIVYGVLQALPSNRIRPIYRNIGWWTGVGFLCICGWSLISAYAPTEMAQLGTALIFIPAKLCLVKAMLILSKQHHTLTKIEMIFVYGPISLIAGWTSLAVFLNWAPLIMDWTQNYISMLTANALVLFAALMWASVIAYMSRGNWAFTFPVIWGLAFIALKQLALSKEAPLIGGLALVSVFILLAITAYKSRSKSAKSV